MRSAVMLVLAAGLPAGALAQDSAPNLVGTWSGPFKTVIFGHNPHHPGSETVSNPPRIREIEFTMHFEGQDGNLLWGHSWSDPARKEPFAATINADGKTIVGADTDGSLTMSIAAPDRIDICYTHTGLGPSQSIVASCGVIERQD
ncbi:MAG TPA: hypothetical protein VFK86_06735 [Bauldia sp.]|nr:hypothetical protein [Bauldia sp.]